MYSWTDAAQHCATPVNVSEDRTDREGRRETVGRVECARYLILNPNIGKPFLCEPPQRQLPAWVPVVPDSSRQRSSSCELLSCLLPCPSARRALRARPRAEGSPLCPAHASLWLMTSRTRELVREAGAAYLARSALEGGPSPSLIACKRMSPTQYPGCAVARQGDWRQAPSEAEEAQAAGNAASRQRGMGRGGGRSFASCPEGMTSEDQHWIIRQWKWCKIGQEQEREGVLEREEAKWPFAPTHVPMDRRPISAISRPFNPVHPYPTPR